MGKARKPLTQRGLASLLRGFEIVPGTVYFADKPTGAKGYKRSDLDDSFSRYLPMFRDSIRQNVRTLGREGESGDFASVRLESPDGSKNGSNGENDSDVLTDENPSDGQMEEIREAEIDRLAVLDAADGDAGESTDAHFEEIE